MLDFFKLVLGRELNEVEAFFIDRYEKRTESRLSQFGISVSSANDFRYLSYPDLICITALYGMLNFDDFMVVVAAENADSLARDINKSFDNFAEVLRKTEYKDAVDSIKRGRFLFEKSKINTFSIKQIKSMAPSKFAGCFSPNLIFFIVHENILPLSVAEFIPYCLTEKGHFAFEFVLVDEKKYYRRDWDKIAIEQMALPNLKDMQMKQSAQNNITDANRAFESFIANQQGIPVEALERQLNLHQDATGERYFPDLKRRFDDFFGGWMARGVKDISESNAPIRVKLDDVYEPKIMDQLVKEMHRSGVDLITPNIYK